MPIIGVAGLGFITWNMSDNEKYLKIKRLADKMYYAAQSLTTDASWLHQAMEEYRQFIINVNAEKIIENIK